MNCEYSFCDCEKEVVKKSGLEEKVAQCDDAPDIVTGNLKYLVKVAPIALAADYFGFLGNEGLDTPALTTMAALGAMAGYFGRLRDALILSVPGYFVAKIGEMTMDYNAHGNMDSVQPDLGKNILIFGGAMAAAELVKKFGFGIIGKFLSSPTKKEEGESF
ncbi:MAG: hypothetical protein Q8R00_00510 [Candidatus Nanoarchaeia archaeon]|nr:hypothetical protein [Candidatus Nanoarchaeia archaeon]